MVISMPIDIYLNLVARLGLYFSKSIEKYNKRILTRLVKNNEIVLRAYAFPLLPIYVGPRTYFDIILHSEFKYEI